MSPNALANSIICLLSVLSVSLTVLNPVGPNTRVCTMSVCLFLSMPILSLIKGGGPYWLAMEGRTYHPVFSTDTTEYDHPAYWLLYDASGHSRAAHTRNLPDHYVEAVRFDLKEHNDQYRTYRNSAQYEPDFEDAYIELPDPGSGDEIAALYHAGSAPRSNA